MTEVTAEVFIFCDDAKHDHRRKVIKFYYRVPPDWQIQQGGRAGWSEHPDIKLLTCGVQLVGDTVPPDDVHPVDVALTPGVRWRAVLGCRRCRVPVVAKGETLFAALDAVAVDAEYEISPGVYEISLSRFAAKVEGIST